MKFLNGLKYHVSKAGNWPFDIKGASILIGVNNNTTKNNCVIRLIDFNSVEKMTEGYLDSGFIKGLQTLIQILEEFLNPELKPKDEHTGQKEASQKIVDVVDSYLLQQDDFDHESANKSIQNLREDLGQLREREEKQ